VFHLLYSNLNNIKGMLNLYIGPSGKMMKVRSLSSEGKYKLLSHTSFFRSFPITLTGNQKIKIGQFNLSLVSSFPIAHRGVHAGTSDPLFKLEGGKFVGDICF
jgi:hypothetical protein